MESPKPKPAPYIKREEKYLEKRRRRYYAVMSLPADARHAFIHDEGKHKGQPKTKLTRSLGTDSLIVARKAAQPFIIAWQRLIEKAQQDAPRDLTKHRAMLTAKELDAIRDVIELTGADYTVAHHKGVMVPGSLIEEPFEALAPDESAAFTFRDGSSVTARGGSTTISGNAFGHRIDEWIKGKTFAAKSLDMAVSDVRAFATKFHNVSDVTRPAVKRWADAQIADTTISTINRKLWALRSYWGYLQTIEEAPADSLPFWDLKLGEQRGRAKKGDKVRAFKLPDLLKILGTANKEGDEELRDLIFCDMYTGARIEELCNLRVQEVKLTADIPHYIPNEGKNAASIRDVPIHPKLVPVMRRLMGNRTNGFLFRNLSANKYGDRSNPIGKRFGHLKTRLGYQANSEVFHSIRHTVGALYKAAGVSESVSNDIIGWENETMNSHYSGAADLDTKAAAVAKLTYAKKAKPARVVSAAAE